MSARQVDLQAVFEARARKVAARPATVQHAQSLGTFALVDVGGQKLGLSVGAVREIIRRPSVTLLPNLPAWLPGIVLVRGGLVSVLDLGRLYAVPCATTVNYLAVLTSEHGDLGLLVDRVVGFRELTGDEVLDGVADPAAHTGVPSRGTTRDLVLLVDVARLFDDPRVVIDLASVDRNQPARREGAAQLDTPSREDP